MGRLVETKKKKEIKRIDSDHPLANCEPLGDRVVVQRDTAKKQTEGGILLPDSMTNAKIQIGTIIRVGPGKRDNKGNLVTMNVKEGDRVILTGYAGLEIRDPAMARSEEDEFVMVREEDILAKL